MEAQETAATYEQQLEQANAELMDARDRALDEVARLHEELELRESGEQMNLAMLRKAREERDAYAAGIIDLKQAMAPMHKHSANDDWLQFHNAYDQAPKVTLERRDEESMRKGFWWGFERARMHPNETNITAEWQSVTALMKSNEEYRQGKQAEAQQ